MKSTEQLSPESLALLELQNIGEKMVFDQPIDSLLRLAGKREQARQTYIQAYKAFQQADPTSDVTQAQADITAATQYVNDAKRIIEETNYPDTDEFSVLRSMVAGQKLEIKLLQDAIELWWWRRFSDAYTKVQWLFPVPANEKSIQDAESAIKSLDKLLDEWKKSSGGRGRTFYVWARKAFEEAATWRDELEKKHGEIQKADYNYWLQFAQEQLSSADDRKQDPLTALAALSRAKSLHKLDHDVDAEASFGGVEEKAKSMFAKQQQDRMKARVDEIIAKINEVIGQTQAIKSEDYLFESKEHRDKVDLLNDYHTVLDVELPKPIEELLHVRRDNLYEARRILSDISIMSNERHDFRVLRLLGEARRKDPDNEDIGKRQKEYEDKCRKHRNEFEQINKKLGASLEHEDPIRAFQKASTALEEMKSLLERYDEPPEEWKNVISTAGEQLVDLKSKKELQETVNSLVKQLGEERSSVGEILERAAELLQQGEVEESHRKEILDGIQGRLAKTSPFWVDVRWIPQALALLPKPETVEKNQ